VLSGLKILDLTSRLPGPLACELLRQLGASVTKIEWKKSPDPFSEDNEVYQGIFQAWYKNLNQNKNIEYKDLESFNFDELKEYDLIIYSPSKKIIGKLPAHISKIEVRGGRIQKYMHDLNALVLSKTMNFNHEFNVPHLPFAGIIYGQQIALKAIAFHHGAQDKETPLKLFLSDISSEVLDLFWSEELITNKTKQFLHNGKFPCYNIYKSSDQCVIALAAVEEHFWKEFTHLFKLNLSIEDRFNTDGRVFEVIKNTFNQYTIQEIKDVLGDKDICLNFLPS